MDDRLLDHYNTELRHLREMAGEFAREFPKIAGRLALDRDAKEVCADPYVERLLEGFAFLAARVHLKLDAEFPRFTQTLLETIYPHFLTPVPSMAVVRFDPMDQEASLGPGSPIPRGTLIKSTLGKGDRTACTFKTAHEVRLLPLRISEARYYTRNLAELALPPKLGAKAALRIRLQATAGLPMSKVALDPLSLYLRGSDEFPVSIFEQILSRKTGLVIQSATERGRTLAVLPPTSIRRLGLSNEEALLPVTPRSFEGYRLLREYFAFPQRFLFLELAGMGEAVRACPAQEIDLVVPLSAAEASLDGRVDASCFELFCTPVINLFSKTFDRISLSDRFSEFHVVPDRNRPLDFETFEIENVTAYGAMAGEEQEFKPFYLARDTNLDAGAFYTTNRVPRTLTAKEKQFGMKSSYSGSEVYLSLVDANDAPYRTDLRQLGIRALCTNRHLPIQLSVGAGRTDFTMDLAAPINSIRCLSGPTLPRASLAEGRYAWRLISHLSLNYLSLIDEKGGEEGAAPMREILKLYTEGNDRQTAKQIEGLRSARAKPIVRRVPVPGPIAFARGLEIAVTFDETAFEGTGVFLLGSVLEQFFARYVSINSFTEMTIRTQQRGEIMRWPAQIGKRQIL
ncbi:MAG TPA: type VI secretion system baseplate subunit TssF [Opitutaceae bacterium]|jgi:type VI secretion system protein ImpG